jgi:hypothetical protein
VAQRINLLHVWRMLVQQVQNVAFVTGWARQLLFSQLFVL